jgi:hypothetical protein
MVFLQVRPEKPSAWWSKTAGGWVTVARDGALGGWTADLDPDCLMTMSHAERAIDGWLEDHDDPWHYRILHVDNLGLMPKPKVKRKKHK